MGPETFANLFAQVFTPTSIAFKQLMADQLTPILTDVLNKLKCDDTCDDTKGRINVLQAAIDEMAPFLGSGGGGGGGGGGS
jgi:hypothetical protein